MPTKNKRISIVISPELDAALREFKDASGMSPASYIRQMIESAVPMIQKMALAFRVAKKNPEAGLIAIQELADSVTVTAAQISLDVDNTAKRRRKVRKART